MFWLKFKRAIDIGVSCLEISQEKLECTLESMYFWNTYQSRHQDGNVLDTTDLLQKLWGCLVISTSKKLSQHPDIQNL